MFGSGPGMLMGVSDGYKANTRAPRDSPLINSFLSSPIPCQSSLLPSTMSIHMSLTIRSGASTGKRYDIRLYIASCSFSSFVLA